MFLLDTDVTIHFRDAVASVVLRVAALRPRPMISLMTLVELEGGVATVPSLAGPRRASLAALLRTLTVVDLDRDVVAAYGAIVSATGYSRRRVIDRLIAATAIVHGLTLVTINAANFRDIPGLTLEVWPVPGQ